jgi:hypothetical protein
VPLQRMAKRAEAPWGPCAQMQDSAATKAKLLSSGHWGPLEVKGGHGGREAGKGEPAGDGESREPRQKKGQCLAGIEFEHIPCGRPEPREVGEFG